MTLERESAVAGAFYPRDPATLERAVGQLLSPNAPQPAIAVMAPHAGYIYSGATAGRVFSAVEIPNRVVILCPNHTGRGERLSVWPSGTWRIPTGDIPIDGELSQAILDADAAFRPDTLAHAREHAIEVELPLLRARNPDVRLSAIVVAHVSCSQAIDLGHKLAEVIRQSSDPVLMVASSDMSHYIPAEQAAVLDRLALDRLEALDPEGLYEVVTTRRISMCGVMPATITLAAAVQLGATRASVIDYTHSGMVTGDDSSVVAYAGAVMA